MLLWIVVDDYGILISVSVSSTSINHFILKYYKMNYAFSPEHIEIRSVIDMLLIC